MILPPFLRRGDAVGIVAPAFRVNRDDLDRGIDCLESWGLRPQCGQWVYGSENQYSGTDAQRLTDLQHMLDHPDIRAVFMARGGYGTTRIMDRLQFQDLLRRPKWIIGFSDITALLLRLEGLGLAAIHGPMPAHFHQNGADAAVLRLKEALFGYIAPLEAQACSLNRPGTAKGLLTGGNLALISHLMGSATEPDFTGKILFLEDTGEYYYNLDRMMLQLRRAGKLYGLAGLMVGQFSDCRDFPVPFGKTAYDIVAEHVEGYGYPLAFGFPIGHIADNRCVPVGMEAQLTVDAGGAICSFEL